MSDNCFTCLNCGRKNAIKGASYTNKYCNNSCQQEHQRRNNAFKKVQEWKEAKEPQSWAKIPDWVKQHLIRERGHCCAVCRQDAHMSNPIPLDVVYEDGDSYNNKENNLLLICPNCRAQRK